MRIVFVVENLATGTLRYTEDLINGLASAGHACKLVCLSGSIPRGAGSTFEFVEMPTFLRPNVKSAWGAALLQVIRPLVLMLGLRRLLVRERPHVLLAQNMDESALTCCLAGMGLKSTLVLFVHDLTERELLVYQHGFHPVALPTLYAAAKVRHEIVARFRPRFIAASEFIRTNIQDSSSYQIEVIRHGPRVLVSKPPRSTGSGGLHLLCVGRLELKKRFDLVIRAMTLLEDLDVVLVVVGDGPLKHDLESLSEKLGVSDRVRFTGYLDDAKLSGELATADLVIVASVWEGFGYVALEAMQASVAVIASRSGSLPEIVRDRVNGRLFSPGDYAELAGIIRELDRDRESLDELRRGAFATAGSYSAVRMVRETEAAFVSFVNQTLDPPT